MLTRPSLRDLLDRLLGRPLSPRRFPPNDWTAEETERRIAHEPLEWGYIFGREGRQIGRKRGGRTTLSLAEFGRDALKDATVIHNHPSGPGDVPGELTFSESDLRFAVEYDVAELRAIAPGWRFLLRRPFLGWPYDEQVMLEEYRRVKRMTDADLSAAVAEGRMTFSSKAAQERHEIFRRLGAAGLLIYRFDRVE